MSQYVPETDLTPTFVPGAAELPAPDDQLRAVDATETFPDEVDLTIGADPVPLGRGYAFDPRQRAFLTASGGRGVLATHGKETLEIWILKCIHTQRGVHPIYSDDFGMRNPFGMIGAPLDESLIGEYEEDLREALTYHPAIADVTDYAIAPTPMGDGLSVYFRVILSDGSSIEAALVA